MTEFSFIRVYLPVEGRTSCPDYRQGSILLNKNCIDWLNEHIGPRANTYHEWILGLPENQHGWYYFGLEYDPAYDYCKTARIFFLRTDAHALMFKLAWGGY